MAKDIYYTSPKGVAAYPRLVQPDTKGEYADGKFKVDLEVTKEVFLSEKAKLQEIEKAIGPKKIEHPCYVEKTDKEGDIHYYLRTKSQYRPKFVDASGVNPIDPDADKSFYVRGGSEIRFSAKVFPHKKGISLQLKKVQVLSLAEAPSEFDSEDGYSYTQPAPRQDSDKPSGEKFAQSEDDADI